MIYLSMNLIIHIYTLIYLWIEIEVCHIRYNFHVTFLVYPQKPTHLAFQPVTHPSTNQTQHWLTSLIGREPLHSTWWSLARSNEKILTIWNMFNKSTYIYMLTLTSSYMLTINVYIYKFHIYIYIYMKPKHIMFGKNILQIVRRATKENN